MLDIARDQGGLVNNAGGGDGAIVQFQMMALETAHGHEHGSGSESSPG